MTIINIRGTNGSGKTTLARELIGLDPHPENLVRYNSPTKKEPGRMKWVEGWGQPGGFLAIGSYKQGCGGMDTIPSFDLQQQAVSAAAWWDRVDSHALSGPAPRHIMCEGVLASTVAGSWLEFFRRFPVCGHGVIIAYLDTPVELCLERITARQIAARGEAREIKVDQVRDKVRAITATRAKFDAAGIRTVLLRHDHAKADLLAAL
jgi:energy-coupling factor transporter ATP-binding protein EcfA2